ncbi:SCO3242 family prenyltransferase [Streptomyces sp. NPDC049837]|uniref:SCO3242 family prenyltransferase n=1 Tax=Streptomyces sp. NPDC049837 TaxID=3155277 RepID=UPI00341E86B8
MTPRLRAWAELLRVSALFSVPGDALAGAAAVGARPNRRTVLAIGSSLCLYEAGMALNDWSDRAEDAVDRPHRPIPSGRVAPPAALAASAALTATGLALAARAGRAPLVVATALAATVWAYDLRLKHTRAAPAAMATARALDLLLGATATATRATPGASGSRARRERVGHGARRVAGAATPAGAVRPAARTALAALPSAAALGAHTYAVTAISRHEAHGGSTAAPLAALAATATLAALLSRSGHAPPAERPGRAAVEPTPRGSRSAAPVSGRGGRPTPLGAGRSTGKNLAAPARHAATGPPPTPLTLPGRQPVTALTAAAYLRTAAVPFLHAALNPSPPLTQRAVGGGIRAMIPLQAALAARGGATGTGLALMGLVPLARALARKVSPT